MPLKKGGLSAININPGMRWRGGIEINRLEVRFNAQNPLFSTTY